MPNYYNPYFQQNIPTPMQTNNNGINWCQGENAAKSYPVAPGNSVLLMDSEESIFYIKSTDQSGMPLPLRIFDYTERTSNKQVAEIARNENDYVSRSEFDAFREDITKTIKGIRTPKVGDKNESPV